VNNTTTVTSNAGGNSNVNIINSNEISGNINNFVQ
jgi:hypothetical protein